MKTEVNLFQSMVEYADKCREHAQDMGNFSMEQECPEAAATLDREVKRRKQQQKAAPRI